MQIEPKNWQKNRGSRFGGRTTCLVEGGEEIRCLVPDNRISEVENVLETSGTSGNDELGWSFSGCIRNLVPEAEVRVFADEWPSWIWVLSGLGWKNIVVFVRKRVKFKKLWKKVEGERIMFRA